jgi:hypothetical protein
MRNVLKEMEVLKNQLLPKECSIFLLTYFLK